MFEVYIGKLASGKIVYVGEGKEGRHKHLNSGNSSCVEANKHLFTVGNLSVEVYKVFLDKQSAVDLEEYLIKAWKPAWNKDKGGRKLKNKPNPHLQSLPMCLMLFEQTYKAGLPALFRGSTYRDFKYSLEEICKFSEEKPSYEDFIYYYKKVKGFKRVRHFSLETLPFTSEDLENFRWIHQFSKDSGIKLEPLMVLLEPELAKYLQCLYRYRYWKDLEGSTEKLLQVSPYFLNSTESKAYKIQQQNYYRSLYGELRAINSKNLPICTTSGKLHLGTGTSRVLSFPEKYKEGIEVILKGTFYAGLSLVNLKTFENNSTIA